MSLMNLVVAARSALARHRRQRRAYDELMALDDKSLADIGIHRSQIHGLAYGIAETAHMEMMPGSVAASAFGGGAPRLATGRSWLPPV